MNERKKSILFITLSTLATLLPLFYGLLLLPILPEVIPTHFNLAGEADGYSNSFHFIIFMPLGMAALNLICSFVTLVDPKNKGYNVKYIRLFLYIFLPLLTNMMMGVTLLKALEYPINVAMVVSLFMGILFILLGNYLPKITQNYTFGIRLPWTLEDPENWRKTHHLSAILFVLGGFIFILVGFFSSFIPNFASFLIIGTFLGMFLIPTIYSYWLYKKTSAS